MSNFHISTSRLDLHVHKSYIFSSNNILLCLEDDFKLKFWSHIFEELSSESNVCLHWRNTVPFIFKYTEATLKVGLRNISTKSCKEGDHSLCEFSKIAETINLYRDNLKHTLMAKHHVNSLIHNSNIHSSYPLMMIIGFEFVFMNLEFVGDIGYVMKQIDRCCFPMAKQAVDEGGFEILIKYIDGVNLNQYY